MITIKLSSPIHAGSEPIQELVVREPKAKDMRTLPSAPTTGDLLNLAGKLCAQPPSVIDQLSIPDMQKVLEAVSSFFPDGQ